MTDAATSAGPAPHDLRAGRAERRLQRLDELADLGMDVARELRRQVMEQAGPGPELGQAFARVSRAVRVTLMLQEKLEQDQEARSREAVAEAAAQRAAKVERKALAVCSTVRNVLDAEVEADETLDDCSLHGGMLDRLDREAEDAAFLDRPLGEIAARICADLGLKPDWDLWEDEPRAADATKAETAAPLRQPPRLPAPADTPQAFANGGLRGMAAERRVPP